MRIHGLTNRELNAVRAQMNKQGQPHSSPRLTIVPTPSTIPQ
jgi:hypothetical protein